MSDYEQGRRDCEDGFTAEVNASDDYNEGFNLLIDIDFERVVK